MSRAAAPGGGRRAGAWGALKLSRSTRLLSIGQRSRFNGPARRPRRGSPQRSPSRGRPSLRPSRPSSAGPLEPGALWGPVGSPACPSPPPSLWCGCGPALSRHLEMPGPGGRGWPAPHYPQRGPCKVWPSQPGGGHLARRDLCPPQEGLQRPRPSGPRSPQPHQSLIFPPSEQLVLPGKLPNESTMRGLWRQNG